MGVNQMTGTPWHLETLKMSEDDDRRHKSRCIYYYKANKNCKRLNLKCPGSAHCDHYKEDPARIREIPDSNTRSRTQVVAITHINTQKVPEKEIVYDGTLLYPAGCHVRHKTYGLGCVAKVNKEYVTVKFDEGFSKELSVAYCVKNSLLVREITEEEAERIKREALIQHELENKKETPSVPEQIASENIQSAETVFASTVNANNESTNTHTSPSKPKTKVVAFWIVLFSVLLLIITLFFILLGIHLSSLA